MSLDQLTQRQKDTGDEIQRLATNYTKDGDVRKTRAYLQQRLQMIDDLWANFEETDTQIRTLYGQRLEHSYFTKSYYDGIQMGYEKFRGQIMSRLPLCKETHDIEDKLLDVPSIKEQDTGQMELKGKEITTDVNLLTETIQDEIVAKVVGANKEAPGSTVRTNQLRVLVTKQQSLMHAIQRTLGNPEGPSESQTLQMRIKTVERHFLVLQELHHKIWNSADAPDMFDYDIESYFNLEEQIQNKLAHLYNQLSQTVQTTNGSRATTANTIRVKLPKISLPKFDGDYLKWRQFRDLFVELVHNQPIAECQKLWYLKTSLSGEAERLIRHLTTSETNYATAWKLINDRYENTRLLVTALINKLLSQQSISVESPIAIKSMHDSTLECLLALQNLGVPTDQWDPIVLHILVKKLDKTTHALWEQSLAQPRNLQSLNTFLDFLETRFQSLEVLGSKGRGTEERRLHILKSLASITNTGITCPACKGDHKLFACRRFLQLSPEKRISLVKVAKLCFNCLSTGHNLTACPSGNCTRCSRKHNTLLHLPDKTHRAEKVNENSGKVLASIRQSASTNRSAKEPVTSPPEIDTSISLTTKMAATTRGYILLSTVLVKVSGGNGSAIECRAVLDSGSQVNLITEKMAKKLRLTEIPESMCIEGIGRRKQQAQRRVSLALQSRINGFNTRLEAYVLPRIVSPQPTQMIDISKWPIPNNIQLADPDFNIPKSVDLLIGAELYYTILYIGQIKLSETLPTLQHTAFGWTAGGKITNESQTQATCAILEEQEMDQQLEKFWRLEETTTNTNNFTAAETRCESHFNQTTRRNSNGRFIVRLPFQKDPTQLGESKDVAFQRFMVLERRLAKSTELKDQYSQFMNEYINLGHMKEVKLDQVERPYCFLPHHCVIKPDSTTTKLRAVFDASAKTSSNLSLNNILYTGPTIQDDVFSILLRFRKPRFVFTADIEKMYRQIQVEEVDQKFQLIWWRSNENERLKCFKLSTVTYGTTCAPYLATKCLQRLSEEAAVEYPLGAKALAHDFYVDDVLTGSDSLTNTIAMQDQLKFILHSAGFKLRKWCSNHPRLLENIPEEDHELQLDFTNKSEEDIKTIGLTWLPKTDEFQIRPSWNNKDKVTKRIALSEIAHLFDPLGIMGPVVVIAKIFLQKLWTLKLDWDAALPQELHSSWIKYREGLKALSSIKIPRHVLAHKVPKAFQIHVFADASEKAYGTAAYLRAVDKDDVVIVRLLCAKSKVAPIKQTTLPRLELCAAKMAVDLSERIKRDLTLKNETIYLWTDSEIVLNWINSPSSSFHTFVANRVSTIQQLSMPQQWRHVGSTDNPADVLSRGIAPERLSSCNLWFYGPIFLHGSEAAWPVPYIKVLPKFSTEIRHTIAAATTADDGIHFVYSVDHRNSFARLKRIVAYVLRFISRIRRQSCETMSEPHLSLQELHEAEETIIRQMQDQEFNGDICHLRQSGEVARTSALSSLTPFLDERGIIRVGGRLEASSLSYDAKHPQLLPYSHQFTKLLINDTHIERCHVGPQALLAILRQKYWPIKGKTLVRSVVQRCVQCAKAKPKFLSQLMGDLPADRVQPARPFVNVGIDFCGPTYTHFKIRGKRPQKSYIAVFCCFSTKATHLEVVSDLSSAGFLGALKRFIGRRGTPRNIYCDNATSFVGAKNQLEEIKDMMTDNKTRDTIAATCSSKGIEFHFIPPRAPHFGGLWEAAVKSAKFMMQRTIASAALTYEELETAVVEIEAILNSRPITPMSSDPNDLMALTPGHFLIGEPLTSSIDPSAQPQHTSLITRWKLVLHIKNEFWRRWSKEYLSQLQHRYKWKQRCQNIEPGHMVIIKEDNTPALKWPLGRIINVIRGNDGLVRVADVRTSSGILRRAIHKLAPLPVEEEQSSTTPVDGLPHSLKPIKCNSNDGQNISKTQSNGSEW